MIKFINYEGEEFSISIELIKVLMPCDFDEITVILKNGEILQAFSKIEII